MQEEVRISIGGETYKRVGTTWLATNLNTKPSFLLRRRLELLSRSTTYGPQLLVANWESGVGYAWWLMESYWCCLAENHKGVSIIAYPKITTIPETIERSPARCIEFDFTPAGSLLKQCQYLYRNGVRTVYLTDQAMRSWRYLFWRLCGVRRIISHDHTPGLRTPPTGIKRVVKWAMNRLPFVTVDLALGATEFIRQRAINVACLPARKCHAIPNGLPPIDAKAINVHAQLGIGIGRKILVSTGRLAPIKNIDFALRLVALVDDVHFLHIGDGPDSARLRVLTSELGVADRVTWAGKRSDVASVLLGCDVAIQPSRGEVGYSLSILEYMRAGLPVLVPDNPSVCGAIRDKIDGFVYPEHNLAAAAELLRRLVGDPAFCVAMGSAGQKSVNEMFTLQKAHLRLREVIFGH